MAAIWQPMGCCGALRQKAPPHQRTFMIKIEHPATVRLHDQVEPLFEPLRLIKIPAQADGFDALAQFADDIGFCSV